MVYASSDFLKVERKNSALYIRLNRPEKQNLLTYEMMGTVRDLLSPVEEDWEIRAVVFQGEGDDFSAGDDPDDLGEWPEEYAHRRPGGSHGPAPIPQQDMLKMIRHLPKPTIAILQGKVLGLGLDLACVCDIRLCSRDAVFGDPRILQARHNTTGLTYILPRLIGQSQAVRLLLLAEQIDGYEAERIGLVYKSFPPDVFPDEAGKIVQLISEMPTRSYTIIKQQILDELDMPYETALMHSFAIRQTNIIEDLQEGLQAFREKRKPRFIGR
jgi:2-(1,2-epoxy-1,2-dihydrophenyl)acetyl-CoA isomerase